MLPKKLIEIDLETNDITDSQDAKQADILFIESGEDFGCFTAENAYADPSEDPSDGITSKD